MTAVHTPVQPDARLVLGVMGGGQLGRMFAQAAQRLGFGVAVLDPDPQGPAGQVAQRVVPTAYTDEEGLTQLAQTCVAVTTEFENVPAPALRFLAEQVTVAPSAEAVQICQDRLAEKQHFQRSGVPCAPHAEITSQTDLDAPALQALLPGILKTAQMGYDGKGQVRVNDLPALKAAFAQLRQVRCVLEQRLPLARELSVIVARGRDGQLVHLPVQQNLHHDGILAVTEVPAPAASAALVAEACACAGRLAESMAYVGVLCVEFFVLQDGRLVANEMAPRPHNSGHYSIDACDVSQFDLQVRALAGLPLVQPRLHSPAVMLNLLGDLWFTAPGAEARTPDWAAVMALPGVHLHLYGKSEARPGRKMGHLTVTAATAEAARAVAGQVAQRLGLPGL